MWSNTLYFYYCLPSLKWNTMQTHQRYSLRSRIFCRFYKRSSSFYLHLGKTANKLYPKLIHNIITYTSSQCSVDIWLMKTQTKKSGRCVNISKQNLLNFRHFCCIFRCMLDMLQCRCTCDQHTIPAKWIMHVQLYGRLKHAQARNFNLYT